MIARWLVKRAALKANLIFTPSNYTKQDVIKRLVVCETKIKVTYEAVDDKEEKIYAVAVNKSNIQKPHFFYVGVAYPHINLELMITAFRKFNKHFNWELVLAGKIDYFYQWLRREVIKEDKNI